MRDRVRTASIAAFRKGVTLVACVVVACAVAACASTPSLQRAAKRGDLRVVEQMLAQGTHPDTGRNRTPLQEAARYGRLDVIDVLIAAGARVDARDDSGRTALLVAAKEQQAAAISRLLAAGAQPDAVDENRESALHHAAHRNDLAAARILLDAGANPDLRQEDRKTPLWIATDRGDRELVELLLANDADASLRDENGRAPLLMASERGRNDLVRLLLVHGALPNVTREDGTTPLLRVIDQRHTAVASALLEAGADPNLGDRNGRLPLTIAVQNRQREMVELLLGHDARPNQGSRDGDPLIIKAARSRDHEIARLLLEAGADPDRRSRSGERAIVIARRNMDVGMEELLVEHDAAPLTNEEKLDEDLTDPIGYAQKHGYTALAEAYIRQGRRAAMAGMNNTNSANVHSTNANSQQHGRHQPNLRRTMAAPSVPPAVSPPVSPAHRPPTHGSLESSRQVASRTRSSFEPFYSRRVAVVIGIDDYRHWPSLEGAARDARNVSDTLREMGFDEVIELYNQEATRTRILTLLGQDLAEKTDTESLALIYFAGHGQTETLASGEKRGYIVPVDGDQERVFATGISMDTLRDLSSRLPSKQVYYAMDSCYSGLGLTRGIARKGSGNDYVRKITSMRAVQMITAGGENEQVSERGGQGLFTTYFLRGLRGEADFDGDGFVTASEIGTYVKPQVTSASKSRQTPHFGSLEGAGEVAFKVH